MLNTAHFHKRNLPHIYIPKHTYFITFRVKGSLPISKLKELFLWMEEQKPPMNRVEKYKMDSIFFSKYDELLNDNKKINYLKNPKLASVVAGLIHSYDKKEYNLIAYSIMPNHVHLVISLLENSKSLDKIMQNIKRISAFKINRILGKRGTFWQSESYDHIVRDEEELQKIIQYTLLNPVKAGLVDNWEDWKFNYLAY